VVLELIVGGIVLLGGVALVYFSTDTIGMSLGVVHAILGLMAFPAGYLLLTGKPGARTLTLGVDAAIIAFSIVSEIILSTVGSLPSGPFLDSIVGTAVAVLIAAIIVYELMITSFKPVRVAHTESAGPGTPSLAGKIGTFNLTASKSLLEAPGTRTADEKRHPFADLRSSGLLNGKVAIITGGSRGIGAASARIFAASGARVVLAARDKNAIATVAKDILSAGVQAVAVPTDVGDPVSVERLVQQALDAYGRLDAAFNNAGDGHMPTPLADVKVEDFERAIRVNLTGVFLSMKYEIPAMLRNGGGGAIVNMSSTAGLNGVKGIAGYVAGKHGIIGLTKTAALDYAQHNIRINAVAPGPILTDRLKQLKNRDQVALAVPIRRIGQPEEVAYTAAWLCSEQASFITGATIPIDGGRMAGIA